MKRKPYFLVSGGKETCGTCSWWARRRDPWAVLGGRTWGNYVKCKTKAHALRQFAKLRRGRAQIDVRGTPRREPYVWRWK